MKHVIILLLIFLFTPAQASELPTSNILYRVLPIKVGIKEGADFIIKEGTAFTIEVDGKQYLITAKHVTNNQAVEIIEIWRSGWTTVKVKTVGIGKENADIIVLAANTKLTHTFEIETGSGGIILGQNVRFLGFPRKNELGGLDIEVYMTQAKEWRIPVVKAGVLTAIKSEKGVSQLLVDGHGNKGFSGGPVIFKSFEGKTEIWKIAGVINRYEPELLSVFDSKGKKIENLVVMGNSGILVATGIEEALELIKSNPIGHPVK